MSGKMSAEAQRVLVRVAEFLKDPTHWIQNQWGGWVPSFNDDPQVTHDHINGVLCKVVKANVEGISHDD